MSPAVYLPPDAFGGGEPPDLDLAADYLELRAVFSGDGQSFSADIVDTLELAAEAGSEPSAGASGHASSLAAALVERGCSLLADDLTGVALDAGERPVALPGFPRQRLEAHTLDRMRWRRRAQSRVGRGLEKYWTPAPRVCAEPLPVCAIFVLEADDRPDVGIEPLPRGVPLREWHAIQVITAGGEDHR